MAPPTPELNPNSENKSSPPETASPHLASSPPSDAKWARLWHRHINTNAVEEMAPVGIDVKEQNVTPTVPPVSFAQLFR